MQTDDALTVPVDATDRAALLERLSRLAEIDHPCLEPVGPAVPSPDGALVVPRGTGTATDLPTVLAVRGRCEASEAAGIAVAVARGLAALHSSGLVHGPLEAADVVVALDGTPRLRPRLALPVGEGVPAEADDVHGLARLVDSLVGSPDADATVALRAALAAALAADPRVRPEAGTLAARVDEAVTPEPVRLPEPAMLAAAALGHRRAPDRHEERTEAVRHRRARRAGSGGAPQTSRRGGRAHRRRAAARRPGPSALVRTGLGAAAVLAGVGLATAVVLQVPGPDRQALLAVEASATPAPAEPVVAASADPVAERDDPAGAAAELTRRRVELLAQPQAQALEEVVLAGSPAHAAAAERLEQAVASGTRVQGVEVTVLETRTEQSSTGTAEVAVEYVVGAHEQTVDGLTTQVPASGPQTATLLLAWTEDGWRVTDVA
ncbi:hypothetical protein [Isoptericola croceus]|uniref:hypothetical protein n=1 Tax=Isoptericola croceus TaxID=3031406 RepID=UPI0023F9BD3D|nr:hypothetical protein [Isoptericola croceus]